MFDFVAVAGQTQQRRYGKSRFLVVKEVGSAMKNCGLEEGDEIWGIDLGPGTKALTIPWQFSETRSLWKGNEDSEVGFLVWRYTGWKDFSKNRHPKAIELIKTDEAQVRPSRGYRWNGDFSCDTNPNDDKECVESIGDEWEKVWVGYSTGCKRTSHYGKGVWESN